MNPTETGVLYDTIAQMWTADTFDLSNGVAQHKRAFQWLKSFGRGLDVGCGCSGRFIDLMLSHELSVTAVDVSSKMVSLARKRHPDVSVLHADVCAWEPPDRYDFVSAWDCLWHVPLHQQAELLSKLMGALSDEGVLIFSLGGLDRPEEKMDSSMGPNLYYATLGIPRTLEWVERSGCVCRHLEFDQESEPHAYVIVQKTRAV